MPRENPQGIRYDVGGRVFHIRPGEPTFYVSRFDDLAGETAMHECWADELTDAEIAALPEDDRARALAEIAGGDRDGEAALHNGEPRGETEAECLAAE